MLRPSANCILRENHTTIIVNTLRSDERTINIHISLRTVIPEWSTTATRLLLNTACRGNRIDQHPVEIRYII